MHRKDFSFFLCSELMRREGGKGKREIFAYDDGIPAVRPSVKIRTDRMERNSHKRRVLQSHLAHSNCTGLKNAWRLPKQKLRAMHLRRRGRGDKAGGMRLHIIGQTTSTVLVHVVHGSTIMGSPETSGIKGRGFEISQ